MVLVTCAFFSSCAMEVQESELIHDRYLNKRFCLGVADNNSGIWLLGYNPPYDSSVSVDEQEQGHWLFVFKKPDYIAADSNIVLAERIRRKTRFFFIEAARSGNSKYLGFKFKDSLQFVSEKKKLGIPDSLTLRKIIHPQLQEQQQKRKPVNIGNWSR
jgi:hypothetical protein